MLTSVSELGACLHPNCVLCGPRNPWSLGLRFAPTAPGQVEATLRAHERLQGYEGIVHGGVTASLLDAAMTHCLFHAGVHAVTATLDITYHEPVPLGVTLVVRGRLVSSHRALHRLEADVLSEGRVLASARARFMPPRATAAQ